MQDAFARARDALGLKAGQARRATIGYLVYKGGLVSKIWTHPDRPGCSDIRDLADVFCRWPNATVIGSTNSNHTTIFLYE